MLRLTHLGTFRQDILLRYIPDQSSNAKEKAFAALGSRLSLSGCGTMYNDCATAREGAASNRATRVGAESSWGIRRAYFLCANFTNRFPDVVREFVRDLIAKKTSVPLLELIASVEEDLGLTVSEESMCRIHREIQLEPGD